MRVPSIGLPLDERRIVREGYRLAEHMLRNYQPAPRPIELLAAQLAGWRRMMHGAYWRFRRH
ncbi:hypothetical protein [Devosia sp. A449]